MQPISATFRTALSACVIMLISFPVASRSQMVQEDLWVTSGEPFFDSYIWSSALSGNTLYIAGNFKYVGPPTGGGAVLESVTGSVDLTFPKVNGVVHAIAPDGAGGWYIGGTFDKVGGVSRRNLAHILSNRTVGSWNPRCDSSVSTLAVSGGTVYAGGIFSAIGDSLRNRIAAIDRTTGLATPWNPDINSGFVGTGFVSTLAVSESLVYAGGEFLFVGDSSRPNLAAISRSTGVAQRWIPSPGARGVHAMALADTVLYIGGGFVAVRDVNGNSVTRNYIAAISTITGNPTPWNPNASYEAYALSLTGTTLYVGGDFQSIGGQVRNRIAALSTSTGNATSWNPNASSAVFSLAVADTIVYAGGRFISIGGASRKYVAALGRAAGQATSWNPTLPDFVYALSSSGSRVFIGGSFTSAGGVWRNNLAALDLTTGAATAWNPDANNEVVSIAASPSAVYVGGNFTSVGGQPRDYLAALHPTTGNATSWNPNCNGVPYALTLSDTMLYVGGDFTNIGGQQRFLIASFGTGAGQVTSWNPLCVGSMVSCIVVSGSTVYAGGSFSFIGGQSRNNLAALNAVSGLATTWDPNVGDGDVKSIAVVGSTVYVGGSFTMVGGQQRRFVAALNAITGVPTSWNPESNGSVYSVMAVGPALYVGGQFTSIVGLPRKSLVALDQQSGYSYNWNPDIHAYEGTSTVASLTYTPSGRLYAGGSFSSVGGRLRSGIVGIETSPLGFNLVQVNRNGLNKPIPAQQSVFDTISISPAILAATGHYNSSYVITDVSVLIDTVLHPNDGDLEFYLTHLSATDTLIYRVGGTGDDFIGTILRDSAQTPIAAGTAPFTGEFKPHAPLARFHNMNPNGSWILRVYDGATGNFGTLHAWGLRLTLAPVTGVDDPSRQLPNEISLMQNYPNPFNPSTTISYQLPVQSHVTLKVYDVLGREVATLVNEVKQPGSYQVNFEATGLASGVYLYRLSVSPLARRDLVPTSRDWQAGTFVQTKKLILLR